jgi:hypothetical protein
MNRINFLKLLGYSLSISIIILTTSCSKVESSTSKPSSKVTFTTGTRIPEHYNSFSFFWKMPIIENGAVLKYVVSIPGHKNLYTHKLNQFCPSGKNIRSDFSSKLLKGIYTPYIKITFTVNEGKIQFIDKSQYKFIFSKTIKATREIE